MQPKANILYIAGSPENEEKFEVSLLFSRPIEHYEDVLQYKFSFAVVLPSKQWCFPNSLMSESITQAEKVPIYEAIKHILAINPDVVISTMFCKSGHTLYASLIELLGLPLAGPGTEAAIFGSNKVITRRMLTHAGVPMPPGIILSKDVPNQVQLVKNEWGFPCIVKSPCLEDSNGTVKVNNGDELKDAMDLYYSYGENIVVEKFIIGRELRSGIIEDNNGNQIFLPVIEYNIKEDKIRKTNDKYPPATNGGVDLAAKHTKDYYWFLNSAKDQALLNKVKDLSLKAFRVLHCRGYAIFDMRVDSNGDPFMLEVNNFCAFGPESVIIIMANQANISGKDVLEFAIARAVKDKAK